MSAFQLSVWQDVWDGLEKAFGEPSEVAISKSKESVRVRIRTSGNERLLYSFDGIVQNLYMRIETARLPLRRGELACAVNLNGMIPAFVRDKYPDNDFLYKKFIGLGDEMVAPEGLQKEILEKISESIPARARKDRSKFDQIKSMNDCSYWELASLLRNEGLSKYHPEGIRDSCFRMASANRLSMAWGMSHVGGILKAANVMSVVDVKSVSVSGYPCSSAFVW